MIPLCLNFFSLCCNISDTNVCLMSTLFVDVVIMPIFFEGVSLFPTVIFCYVGIMSNFFIHVAFFPTKNCNVAKIPTKNCNVAKFPTKNWYVAKIPTKKCKVVLMSTSYITYPYLCIYP